MTTENGTPKLSTIREYADVLVRRMAYLHARIEQRTADGAPDNANDYDRGELAAIGFALPLIEAQWDMVARLQREHIMPADGKVPSSTWEHSAAKPPTVEQLLVNLEQSVVAARAARDHQREVATVRPSATLL